MKNRVLIAGVGFNNVDRLELIGLLDDAHASGSKSQVCFVPANSVMAARKSAEVAHAYQQSEFVICDGVPVRWASLLLGTPLKERITGFDFFPQFIRQCANRKYSVFFLGAAPGIADELVRVYQQQFPDLDVRGVYCPPMTATFPYEENERMIQLINAAQPDVLFVSLTAPKQDAWIRQHWDRLHVKIAMGVGAAFSSEIGRIRRAPQWMQSAGLEWLYRFLQEPRRLFRRYFIEAPPFIGLVIRQRLFQKHSSSSSQHAY
ncbi:MAG: WecB/TagA/CpsF family glycosyltransferase [Bacteroidetes bacterium]|nr:WecB/TagA/CpsF family glycosyltransferase [Bacteroidota bacterium]